MFHLKDQELLVLHDSEDESFEIFWKVGNSLPGMANIHLGLNLLGLKYIFWAYLFGIYPGSALDKSCFKSRKYIHTTS